MPVASVHRKASAPEDALAVELDCPTTTCPLAETAYALLLKLPPGRSPSPTMPVVCVQRNASVPEAETPSPTTTSPSAETPVAALKNPKPEGKPPGKYPRPTIPVGC